MMAQLLNLDRKFKPAVVSAIRTFRHSKPWQGTLEERKAKFQSLHDALCAIYGKSIKLNMDEAGDALSGGAHVNDDFGTIHLLGNLSVVNYLNRFRYAQTGGNGHAAYKWSASLYVRFFKLSASRMYCIGPFIVRPELAEGNPNALRLADVIEQVRSGVVPPPVAIQQSVEAQLASLGNCDENLINN